MSKRKRLLVSAVFSFYLLVNVLQIFCGFGFAGDNGSEGAAFIPRFIYRMAKQYDENRNFIGCMGIGYDCFVIPIGQNLYTVSSEGVHSQPAK